MKNIFKLAACGGMLLLTTSGKAQVDPHFSQYYSYTSWLNPALTGAFNGSFRISGIYRNQWGSITNAFQTPGISAEFTTDKNVAFGASLMSQSAGDGGYSYTNGYASFAFQGVRFGNNGNHRILLGLQAGILDRRFNPDKLHFGDQWNPITGYNPGVASADQLVNRSATAFDANAGALYMDATPGKKANFYIGFSAAHLTRPVDKFSVGGDQKLPVRFIAHAGVRIQASESFSLTPNLLYLRQGSAEEKMVSLYGQFQAAENFDFLIGGNYRFKDAIAPYVGFNYKNATLGFSYDVNVSDLSKMAGNANSFEISLTLIGSKKVKLPTENFICPRL